MMSRPADASSRAADPPVRLMTPGPVPLSTACHAEFSRPVEPHYGPAWVEIHRETLTLMGHALGTERADIYPLVGSGSAGLDAAIGSLIEPGDRVVVGVNGYFGERLATIARAHGAEAVEVHADWGEPIGADRLDAALESTPDAAAVLFTHVETSTGVCNPAADLAATARRRGVPVLLDAVSSAGGMEVSMDAWGIDICVTASQKCLGGAAGLAPVAVGEQGWRAIERTRSQSGWYLDLRTWREYATRHEAWHPTPVTMPTNVMRSLRQGLRELLAEGVAQRASRLRALAERLRSRVRESGLSPLVAERWAAPVVTAIRSPEGVPSGDIVRFVEEAHGIRIAGGGLGLLGDRIFRVGHMAPSLTANDIDDVIAALEAFLRSRSGAAASHGPRGSQT